MPVKSTKEVVEVLPNLFEEFLDEKDLSYYAIKLEENKYLGFAYNKSVILKFLKDKGISLSNIIGIYFAQIELYSIAKSTNSSCMKIDNICVSYIDDILVQIPLVLKTNIDNSIDINNIKLSKHKIDIDSSSKYLNKYNAYFISIVLLILSFLVIVKYIVNNIEQTKIEEKQQNIKLKYNIPASIIQTKSLIKKYTKDSLKQTALRDTLYHILSIKQRLNITIYSLEQTNNKIVVKLKTSNKNSVRKYFRNYHINLYQKDKILIVEIKL